jgi:hypothetical protein
VQLIFNHRVSKRTQGRFRTQPGESLSLHIDYKNSRIEQYFKQAPEVREMGARPRPSSTTRATFHRQAAA